MDSELEKRVEEIELRNKKVEADKGWEVSKTRRALVALAVYIIVGLYLIWLHLSKPWLNALVPPLAFLISTLALQRVKQVWTKHYKQKR